MKVAIASDRVELGRYVAQEAADTIRECLKNQPECNLVVATGSSQFEVLDHLVQAPDVDWSRVNGFHLDEYVGIPKTHAASFCGYLAQRFVERVTLKSFHFLDGTLQPEELAQTACDAIAGKRIDLMLCGIGENAHLAFNDPPADFEVEAPYQIVELDEACRRQQVGEGWFDSLEQVPPTAISMTVHQIMSARRILCSVPDRRKAAAVRATVEDMVSPEVPASILRNHGATTLVLEPTSASLLSEASRAQAIELGEPSQSS
ncbi:MAG: glucosamine-6-phosphate deaminase [Aureliella sp.]